MAMCGGYSAGRAVREEERTMWESVAPDQLKGKDVKLIDVSTQVVAGTNYTFRLTVDGEMYEAKVFKPLPHTGNPPSLAYCSKSAVERVEDDEPVYRRAST